MTREVLLRIEESAYEQLMGFIRLCPQVEVVSEDKGIETRESADLCVACAIREMRQNGAFRYPSDYTYIMLASNEGLVKGLKYFYSPREFIDYLKELELDGLPGRSTLYDTIAKTSGSYPDWTFSDNAKDSVVLRRKNIARQFLSAFGRARRRLSDGVSDNR
jgi:hypothetical protein